MNERWDFGTGLGSEDGVHTLGQGCQAAERWAEAQAGNRDPWLPVPT